VTKLMRQAGIKAKAAKIPVARPTLTTTWP
jgi:hypothetical protein